MEQTQLSQLEKLKQQKEKLEAKIQKAENRQKMRERKEETRRKILIGALFLEKFKKEGMIDSIKQELNAFLTRNSDRVLFDLPELQIEKSQA